MEFFNKKEDVIDLQLTQYGRLLLSKGKFNPTYYSFFDDNILYNSAQAGLPEVQNRTEERIREAQTMQPQVGISSLEKEFSTSYNLVLSGDAEAGDKTLQRTAESYMLNNPIGTSDINAEYAPSWSVQYLNGYLSSSLSYKDLEERTGGKNTVLIPQLETEIKIKTMNIEDETLIEPAESLEDASNSGIVSSENDMYVLLKVVENNGLFQKNNFDIEVFEIQEEIQGDKKIETIRPLSFDAPRHSDSDNLGFMDRIDPSLDNNYVEYYFDLLVDDEIRDQTLCELDPVNQNLGVFADPRTKLCQDVLNQQKKKVFNIYIDEEDSPGEIC